MTPAAARVELAAQTFLFGEEAAGARLAAEIASAGWRRVAVLVSPSVRRAGRADELLQRALGTVEAVVHDGSIASHAPISGTTAVAEWLAGCDADAVVALGGGSVSDTAKGAVILLAEGGRLEDHCSTFEPPDRFDQPRLGAPKLPLVVVPTTLSGAEVTPGGGATTADGIKRTFWDPKVAARLVAYDPAVFADVPAAVLTSTGMNALAHCAEGLYSRTANPVSTALARSGTEHLASALRRYATGDRSAGTLTELGTGAALAGMVIANARVGLHHAICHVLGAAGGLSHGDANSVMLPHVLRYNLPATGEAQAVFARAAAPGGPVGDAPCVLADLQAAIDVPRRLREVGVPRDALPSLARQVMQDRGLYFNPRRATLDDVLVLLEEAW